MEVRREYDRFPVQILLVVIGLALALLLGGAAGYALHGPVAQHPSVIETVTKDQVQDWMRQGSGPNDADADQAAQDSAAGR